MSQNSKAPHYSKNKNFTVLGVVNVGGRNNILAECNHCNNTKIYSQYRLARNKSCGCKRRELISNAQHIHGLSKTVEFSTWVQMRARCNVKSHQDYRYYGGRGIKVCKRWMEFLNFYNDMGIKPKGLTIDRIDNDKNYEPSNCKWSTPKEQARNRSNNRYIKYKGLTKTVVEWSEITGIKSRTIHSRLKKGWVGDDVLKSPRSKKGTKRIDTGTKHFSKYRLIKE